MGEVGIIGVDLAKNVFQVRGAAGDGSVVFRKKLSRPQFARFIAEHPPCLVAMEACAIRHHWAREMSRHGHEVRLIAPHCVKPFIKRQKNDAADAEAIVEAIVEAAQRPTMRYVEPKSSEQQARAIPAEVETGSASGIAKKQRLGALERFNGARKCTRAVAFRTREQLVKRRTEAVNALRSHLYEFGHVAPEGIGYLPRLERVLEDPDADIPDLARDICRMLLEQIVHLTDRIDALKARIARHAGPEIAKFGDAVFAMHDRDEMVELLRSAGFSDPAVNQQPKSLRLPPPADFLWQYIHSTPLAAGVSGKTGPDARTGLERDVRAGWRDFETTGGMDLEVGITTAYARK